MSTDAEIAARLDAIERKVDALGAGRLTDRIDRIEALVDAFGTLAERLPVIADATATGASWAWSQAEQRGVDPIAAGQRAADLGLSLALPENLALAERLLASRAALKLALDALDTIDPADLETVTKQGASLTHTLAALLRAPELTALVDTRKQTPAEPVGLFGALRRMGDPDVQRAVGFTLGLAKRFGQLLGRS